MVEMVETAKILSQSTPKSLVIMDEIGRGTATFDGMSIAWSVVERLSLGNKCRTLFATHYHELTKIESLIEKVKCYTTSVIELSDSIVFTHKVVPGKAKQSYAIHVAELAGVPGDVLLRASQILDFIDHKESVNLKTDLIVENFSLINHPINKIQQDQILPSLSQPILDPIQERNLEKFQKMKNLVSNVDDITPKQALNILYQLNEIDKD